MNEHYVIQWRSMENGRAGRGTKVFDREEAEQLVEELNAEYPDILHELVPAPDPSLGSDVHEEAHEPVAG